MKKLNLLAIAIISFIATSCMGHADASFEYTRSLQSATNFSVVYDIDNATETVIVNGATYELSIMVDEGKLSLAVSNLQLTPNSGAMNFVIKNITFKYDENQALTISVPNNIENPGMAINDLRLNYLERYMDSNTLVPVWDISFTLNGRYKVRAVQKSVIMFGTCHVDMSGTGYDSNTAYYGLNYDLNGVEDNKIKANFYLYNAKFAASMPQMNLVIKDIPTVVNYNGFTMDANTLSIYVADTNVEQPDYKITDFTGRGFFGVGNNLVNFDFMVGGRFQTTLDLGFKFPTEVIQ